MRPRRHEAGLTFVEVLLVTVIVAILVAIAIPTFLGAKKRALDEQVQATLRKELSVQNANHRAEGHFSESAAGRSVTARAFDGQDMILLSATSRSGRMFCVARVSSGRKKGTYYGRGQSCREVRGVRDLSTRNGWATRSETAW